MQHLFLLNLSLSEFVQNIIRLIFYSFVMYIAVNLCMTPSIILLSQNQNISTPTASASGVAPSPSLLHASITVAYFGEFVLNTGMIYQCFMAMILLTADRLMCILLGIRYPMYWSSKKTLVTIMCTWLISLTTIIAVCLYANTLHDHKSIGKLQRVIQILWATFALSFLTFAIFSYAVMFQKFLLSRRSLTTSDTEPLSAWKTFRKSKFFVCVMLVSSFLVLWVLPTVINTIGSLPTALPERNSPILQYVLISVILSDTADGIIYVFLTPDVRNLLKKMFGKQQNLVIMELELRERADRKDCCSFTTISTLQ